jgi:hypothetical protein
MSIADVNRSVEAAMSHYRFIFAMIAILLGLIMTDCSADDGQKVVVNTNAAVGKTRLYDVVLSVKDASAGGPAMQLTMKIHQKYVDRSEDGVTLMESSMDEGTFCSGDQKLYISPSTYPKLTVLLDRNYRIKDIFGWMRKDDPPDASCINYSNMPVLFFLPDGEKEHAVGVSWESAISLPTPGESFKIINTLKGIETIDGENIAVVDQQISRTNDPLSSVSAESRFATGNGRLLKSRVSCSVHDAADPKSMRNITIDITLSK